MNGQNQNDPNGNGSGGSGNSGGNASGGSSSNASTSTEPPNNPPELLVTSTSVMEGNRLFFAFPELFQDPDASDNISVSSDNLPPGLTLDAYGLNWVPGYFSSGTHSLALTLDDGKDSVEATLQVQVTDRTAPHEITNFGYYVEKISNAHGYAYVPNEGSLEIYSIDENSYPELKFRVILPIVPGNLNYIDGYAVIDEHSLLLAGRDKKFYTVTLNPNNKSWSLASSVPAALSAVDQVEFLARLQDNYLAVSSRWTGAVMEYKVHAFDQDLAFLSEAIISGWNFRVLNNKLYTFDGSVVKEYSLANLEALSDTVTNTYTAAATIHDIAYDANQQKIILAIAHASGLVILNANDLTLDHAIAGTGTNLRSVAVADQYYAAGNSWGVVKLFKKSDETEADNAFVPDNEGYEFGNARAVSISGNTISSALNSGGWATFRVTNNGNDTFNIDLVKHTPIMGYIYRVSGDGNLVFGFDGENGLVVLDVSDPLLPKYMSSVQSWSLENGVKVGNILYTVGYEFMAVDLSDPAIPSVEYRGTNHRSVAIAYKNGHLFASGTQLWIFNPNDLTTPVHSINIATTQVGFVGNHLVTAAGGTVQVIDASNPGSATIVGSLAGQGSISGVKVKDDVAFFLVANGDVKYYSISDPTQPTYLGALSNNSQAYVNAIWIDGNFLYVTDKTNGSEAVKLYNITDPENPVYVSSVEPHLANCCAPESIYAKDGILYSTISNGGISIIGGFPSSLNP